MNPASSRGCHPGRSLAVGLLATLLWKSAYHASELGYLTWFSALLSVGIAVAAVLIVAMAYRATTRVRALLEHAHLHNGSALASKA